MPPNRDEPEIVILAREAAFILRQFYDDITPCVHHLHRDTQQRCRLCGRARALLIECDAIVDEGHGMEVSSADSPQGPPMGDWFTSGKAVGETE